MNECYEIFLVQVLLKFQYCDLWPNLSSPLITV